MEEIEKKVVEWAETRGIYVYGTNETRFKKLLEEVWELTDELDDELDRDQLQLEAGDVIVTLINFLHPYNLSLSDCLEAAYEKIKKRRGKMRDGFFMRDDAW